MMLFVKYIIFLWILGDLNTLYLHNLKCIFMNLHILSIIDKLGSYDKFWRKFIYFDIFFGHNDFIKIFGELYTVFWRIFEEKIWLVLNKSAVIMSDLANVFDQFLEFWGNIGWIFSILYYFEGKFCIFTNFHGNYLIWKKSKEHWILKKFRETLIKF